MPVKPEKSRVCINVAKFNHCQFVIKECQCTINLYKYIVLVINRTVELLFLTFYIEGHNNTNFYNTITDQDDYSWLKLHDYITNFITHS